MIAKTLLFTVVALVALYLIGRSAVWLYFYFKKEVDLDRQDLRDTKREASEAVEDLERAVERLNKKGTEK